MHKYLRAIGFSELTKFDLEEIVSEIVERPETYKTTRDSEGNKYGEYTRSFAPNIGIMVRGCYDDFGVFIVEYCYPYFIGATPSTREVVEVIKHAEKESYAGVCDDIRLGVTLIFYLQNVADYLAEQRLRVRNRFNAESRLASLSVEGKILLPIRDRQKTLTQGKNKKKRNQLMEEARDGDTDAIENLAISDMKTFANITRRIQKEDVLSIVTSTFMPYGIESDQYSVIGTICELEKIKNRITGETLYVMKLECNDMYFDVCINEKDLVGEPVVGRRFKGVVWMQGSIDIL